MRILIICDYFYPYLGGMESHIMVLCEYLIEKNHKITIITRRISETHNVELIKKIKVIRFPYIVGRNKLFFGKYEPPLIDPLFKQCILDFIRENSHLYDVIHLHGVVTLSILPQLKKYHQNILITIHDYWPICFRRNLLNEKRAICEKPRCTRCLLKPMGPLALFIPFLHNFFVKKSFKAAKKVIFVSNFSKQRVQMNLHFKINSVTIYNWTKETGNQMKIQQNTENIDIKILFIGRLSLEKGITIFLKAVRELQEPRKQIEVQIVGVGPLGKVLKIDKPRSFSLSKKVKVKSFGLLEREEIMKLLIHSTVLVVPSIYHDPCPTVILEAMSQGIPVVGSKVGGIPELIIEEKNGVLCEPNNYIELKRALLRILELKNIIKSQEIKEIFAHQFSINELIPKLIAIYSNKSEVVH